MGLRCDSAGKREARKAEAHRGEGQEMRSEGWTEARLTMQDLAGHIKALREP